MPSLLQISTSPLQYTIPSYAAAFGITQTPIYSTFSTANVDTANTGNANFEWFVGNPPRWQGFDPWPDPVPIFNTDYTISGSVLNITNNPGTASNGLEFSQRKFSTANPTVPTGSLPLLSGAKPFYFEVYLKSGVNNLGVDSGIFIADIGVIQQSINNSGSRTAAEIDLFECFNGTSSTFTIHKWTSATANTAPLSVDVSNTLWSQSVFNRWGVLFVPMAFNSGTGLVRLYINRRTTNVPDYTYTSDDVNFEGSSFLAMFAAALNSQNPFSVGYIAGSIMP